MHPPVGSWATLPQTISCASLLSIESFRMSDLTHARTPPASEVSIYPRPRAALKLKPGPTHSGACGQVEFVEAACEVHKYSAPILARLPRPSTCWPPWPNRQSSLQVPHIAPRDTREERSEVPHGDISFVLLRAPGSVGELNQLMIPWDHQDENRRRPMLLQSNSPETKRHRGWTLPISKCNQTVRL